MPLFCHTVAHVCSSGLYMVAKYVPQAGGHAAHHAKLPGSVVREFLPGHNGGAVTLICLRASIFDVCVCMCVCVCVCVGVNDPRHASIFDVCVCMCVCVCWGK